MDLPGQPVPPHRAGRVVGVQDQPGQPVPPQRVVGRLVAGQPGAAGRVAELGVEGPAAGGQVGDLLPAAGAGPGQRRGVVCLIQWVLICWVRTQGRCRPRRLHRWSYRW